MATHTHTYTHRRTAHTHLREIYVTSQCMKFYFKYNSKYFSISPLCSLRAVCGSASRAESLTALLTAQLTALPAAHTRCTHAPHLKSVAFKVRRVFVF